VSAIDDRIASLEQHIKEITPFIEHQQLDESIEQWTPLGRLIAATNYAELEKKRKRLAKLLKAQRALGRRIRCDYMYDIIDSTGEIDEAARKMVGACGTVESVDDACQLHVKWDNGSALALNPECDEFTVLDDKQGFSNAAKRMQQTGFVPQEDGVSFEEFLHSGGRINWQ